MDEQSATMDPGPATMDQQPATMDQQPLTMDRQPTIMDPGIAAIDPQPSAIDSQPTTMDPGLIMMDPQPSTTGMHDACEMGSRQSKGHAESQSKAGAGKKKRNGRRRRRGKRRRRLAAEETDGWSDEEEDEEDDVEIPQPETSCESESMCSICQDAFNDARYLPCDHMFCLDCIKQLVEHTSPTLFLSTSTFQWRFEKMPVCPLCRRDFSVPPIGGFDALPKSKNKRRNEQRSQSTTTDDRGSQGLHRGQEIFHDDADWNATLELLNNPNLTSWLRDLQAPGVSEYERMLGLQIGLHRSLMAERLRRNAEMGTGFPSLRLSPAYAALAGAHARLSHAAAGDSRGSAPSREASFSNHGYEQPAPHQPYHQEPLRDVARPVQTVIRPRPVIRPAYEQSMNNLRASVRSAREQSENLRFGRRFLRENGDDIRLVAAIVVFIACLAIMPSDPTSQGQKTRRQPPPPPRRSEELDEVTFFWEVAKGSDGTFISSGGTSAPASVDGNPLTCFVASTDELGKTWWALDMKEATAVKFIRIVNVNLPFTGFVLTELAGSWKKRSVTFLESQLSDFTVKLMNPIRDDLLQSWLCGSYRGSPPAGKAVTVLCNPATPPGQYLVIENAINKKYLAFCEIEVFRK